MATASKGYFAISQESVAGTAITSPDFYYPVNSVDFPYEEQFIENYEIKGSRQAMSTQPGVVEGSASVSGLLYPSGAMGLLLKALFGKVTSTEITPGQGGYLHTYADTTTGALPSLTLERADAFASEGGLFAERLAGAKLESMSIECPFGDLVTYTANFQAIKKPILVSPSARPGSNPWPISRAVTFTGATIKIGGTANATFSNLSIEFTNNLQRQNALNGTNESVEIMEAGLSCTVTGQAMFKTLELRQKLENSAEFSVEVGMSNNVVADTTTAAKEGFKFIWPKAKVQSVGLAMQANEVITSDVSFRVDFDDAINAMVQAFMTNKEDGTDY